MPTFSTMNQSPNYLSELTNRTIKKPGRNLYGVKGKLRCVRCAKAREKCEHENGVPPCVRCVKHGEAESCVLKSAKDRLEQEWCGRGPSLGIPTEAALTLENLATVAAGFEDVAEAPPRAGAVVDVAPNGTLARHRGLAYLKLRAEQHMESFNFAGLVKEFPEAQADGQLFVYLQSLLRKASQPHRRPIIKALFQCFQYRGGLEAALSFWMGSHLHGILQNGDMAEILDEFFKLLHARVPQSGRGIARFFILWLRLAPTIPIPDSHLGIVRHAVSRVRMTTEAEIEFWSQAVDLSPQDELVKCLKIATDAMDQDWAVKFWMEKVLKHPRSFHVSRTLNSYQKPFNAPGNAVFWTRLTGLWPDVYHFWLFLAQTQCDRFRREDAIRSCRRCVRVVLSNESSLEADVYQEIGTTVDSVLSCREHDIVAFWKDSLELSQPKSNPASLDFRIPLLVSASLHLTLRTSPRYGEYLCTALLYAPYHDFAASQLTSTSFPLDREDIFWKAAIGQHVTGRLITYMWYKVRLGLYYQRKEGFSESTKGCLMELAEAVELHGPFAGGGVDGSRLESTISLLVPNSGSDPMLVWYQLVREKAYRLLVDGFDACCSENNGALSEIRWLELVGHHLRGSTATLYLLRRANIRLTNNEHRANIWFSYIQRFPQHAGLLIEVLAEETGSGAYELGSQFWGTVVTNLVGYAGRGEGWWRSLDHLCKTYQRRADSSFPDLSSVANVWKEAQEFWQSLRADSEAIKCPEAKQRIDRYYEEAGALVCILEQDGRANAGQSTDLAAAELFH